MLGPGDVRRDRFLDLDSRFSITGGKNALLACRAMVLDRDTYRRRLDGMRQRLAGIPSDGLFATPSSNLFYLTGIDFHRSERLTALFLFADRDPVVICPAF